MSWKTWKPGDPITINRIVWSEDLEGQYIKDVLDRDWFGPGKFAERLETELCDYVGLAHAQLANSGSSALLLATQALQQTGRWRPGDKILHPGCTFPTSLNPIIQSGMIPVFVDVEPGTYNINADLAAEAIKKYPDIKGAIIPHLLGNSPDMDKLLSALDDRPLIEDCCDTLGSRWAGQHVGTMGDAAAFSFYGSHHITTAGVGGALLTNDPDLYHLVKSMTFWGRALAKTDDIYNQFMQRYSYETIGYDMQMSEIQAAFGVAQMRRLEPSNANRTRNFRAFDGFFSKWEHWFVLPKSHEKAQPSWFGYPLSVRPEAPFTREDFARHLLGRQIEIRPLFAGDITRQPAYDKTEKIIYGELTTAYDNARRALFLPSWGGLTVDQMAMLMGIYSEFLERW